jgi:hypothetical protein
METANQLIAGLNQLLPIYGLALGSAAFVGLIAWVILMLRQPLEDDDTELAPEAEAYHPVMVWQGRNRKQQEK